MTTMRATISSALFVLCIVASSTGFAQDEPAEERPEPSPELDTQPAGAYLESQTTWPQERTQDDNKAAYVDRRLEVDPMTGQSILWPTAYTAEAGTITYTNFFLVGNTLSVAVTDDFTLGGTVVLPTAGALHLQATGRIRVHDGPNHIVTVIPAFHYQREGEEDFVQTAAVSTGVGVVADFYLADGLLVGAGMHTHLTLGASTASVESSDCPDRDAFFNNECTDIAQEWRGFPSGGHWVALSGHAIYYITDWINLRAELFTGGVAGTFMGSEYIYGRETLAERSARYQDGDFAIGIPYDSLVTAGLGTGLTFGSFAMQLSTYAFTWDDEIRLTPMFVASVTF